jgi:predicted  nucleic acid-binding Zn-ribbon protein
MKKAVVPLLVVLTIVSLGAAFSFNQKLTQTRTDFAELQAEEQATNVRYSAAIEEVASIQQSLNEIDLGDQGTQALQSELAQETSLSEDRGEQTMARIAEIKAGVERANSRIRDLDEKVKAGEIQIAGLEELIGSLRYSAAEKEQQITQLVARVDELQTQVVGLETEVAIMDETLQETSADLEHSRRELGTVYYVVGTRKELSRAGIIESKGGILGIGKTVKPTGSFDLGHFTALDTDYNSIIPVEADEARVVSAQPVDSYALADNGSGIELRILDPEAFRAVKHVIIVKN